MADWTEETDGNNNVAGLRTRRARPRRVVVPGGGSIVRIDTPPMVGRKTVHFQNLSTADLKFALSETAPATAPGILKADDFRTFLAGEAIGVYAASTGAGSTPVFLQETAA